MHGALPSNRKRNVKNTGAAPTHLKVTSAFQRPWLSRPRVLYIPFSVGRPCLEPLHPRRNNLRPVAHSWAGRVARWNQMAGMDALCEGGERHDGSHRLRHHRSEDRAQVAQQ